MIRHAVELIELSILWSWLAAAFCVLFSVVLMTLLIRIGGKLGWVVVPRQDRWSRRTVVQFGGVPILIAFLAGSVLFAHTTAGFALLLLTLGAGALGLFDDIKGLGPRPKLAAELVLASLAIYFGYLLNITPWTVANVLITLLWIVGITNAYNLIDNMDGLAAGIAAIGLIPIVVLSGPDVQTRSLALCMLGALIGFLMFNVHPAKVFMGDSGALAIGFFLACAVVGTANRFESFGSRILIPVLITFIPIFDMLLVSVTRRLRGRRISLGARDHSSHRLVLMGMKDSSAVLVLYGFGIGGALTLVIWKLFVADFGAGLMAVFLLGAALFWFQLAKLKLPDTWLSKSVGREFYVGESLRRLLTVIFAGLLDSGFLIAGLYLAFVYTLEKTFTPSDPRFVLSCVGSVILTVPVVGLFRSITHKFDARPTSPQVLMIFKETLLVATLMSAGLGLVFLWKPFPISAFTLGVLSGSLLLGMSRLIVLWMARVASRILTAKETDEALEPAVAKSS